MKFPLAGNILIIAVLDLHISMFSIIFSFETSNSFLKSVTLKLLTYQATRIASPSSDL